MNWVRPEAASAGDYFPQPASIQVDMANAHAMRKYHFLISLAVVFLDQAAKWVVAKNLGLHDSLMVIPGLFRITHVQNRGAAFGLFSDSPSEWKIALLISFSVVALVVVSALLWKNS